VAAFSDGDAVGFAGVTSRRFAADGREFPVHVLSFVAVHPDMRKRGIARGLYAALLAILELPVLAFSEPGSPGERVLLASFEDAGFRHRELRRCRSVGFAPNIPRAISNVTAETTDDYSEFAAVIESAGPNTLWNSPTAEQWAHYRRDPRQRFTVVAREEGRTIGTARVVIAELVSADGVLRVPMVESACFLTAPADALRAVFEFAVHCQGTGSAPTVLASNLSHVDDSVFRAAGARSLPTTFNAHLFERGDTALPRAITTNLEVI
jgi:predicted N-acetyltransferase YhbS